MRRFALGAMVAAAAVSGLVGAVMLLQGDFSTTQWRILGTTFFVLATCLLAAGCSVGRLREVVPVLPYFGGFAAVTGFGLLTAAIWQDDPAEGLVKSAVALVVLTVGVTFASLLSTADPGDSPIGEGARVVAYVSLAAAVLLSEVAVVSTGNGGNGEGLARAIGIASITLAASSIGLFAAHLQGRGSAGRESSDESPAWAVRYCPSCAWRLPSGQALSQSCPGCGAVFVVILEKGQGEGQRSQLGIGDVQVGE